MTLLPSLYAFERAWIDAAYTAMYPDPPRSPLPKGISQMEPARFYGELLARVPTEQALGLRVTVWIIALAPLFVLHRLATIRALSEPDRVKVLERLLASPIYAVRQLVLGFKAMGSFHYTQDREVRRALLTVHPAPAPADSGPVLREGTRTGDRVRLPVVGREGLMATSSSQTRAANEITEVPAAAAGGGTDG